jgi:hypothetical protein
MANATFKCLSQGLLYAGSNTTKLLFSPPSSTWHLQTIVPTDNKPSQWLTDKADPVLRVLHHVLPTMETAKAFTFTCISFCSHHNCPTSFHPICASDLVNTTLAYVKNTPRISVYTFTQPGNLPNFKDKSSVVFSTTYSLYHNFTFFCSNNTHTFHKPRVII